MAERWGVARDGGRRLVAGVTGAGPTSWDGATVAPVYEPGAVDLSLARAGRLPLLLDHHRRLDQLAGMVDDAWLADGRLHFLGRLADSGVADDVWRLVDAGMPVSLSGSYEVVAAEEVGRGADGGPLYTATAIRLVEVSFVVLGRDPASFARVVRHGEVPAMLARRAAATAAEPALERRHRLRLDRWCDAWPWEAGARIAAATGADPAETGRLLAAETWRWAEQIVEDLV
jgi:hypothetical protein